MWKMTTYKYKLQIRRLERETYLSRTENNILALKSSTNTKQKVQGRHKHRVGQVSGNKQLFTPYKQPVMFTDNNGQ